MAVFKFVVVILLSLLTFTTAQEFVAGKIISRGIRKGRATRSTGICTNTLNIATFCEEDDECTTGIRHFTCINGAYQNDIAGCPNYCIGNPGEQFCSTTAGSQCASNAQAVCKTPGYFPDPSNCYIYYYCYLDASNALKSYTAQCPTGAPFNPAGPEDRKCQLYGSCIKATCTAGLAAEWRAMNYYNFTNNRIAMKCLNGQMDYVHQCAGGLSLDTTYTAAPRCSIKCVTNYQKAVYILDKTMYYQCILGTASLYKCEVPKIFDPEKLTCV